MENKNDRAVIGPRGLHPSRWTAAWDATRVEREDITIGVVERLVGSQFPQWARLPISPVPESGVDNCTYRLGEHMSVRLPAAERYAHQVDKEHRWLPTLSRHVPLPIPEPVGRGEPGHGYPWH
jgi:aminoglycoside phosphotransferase (APT) family kinase protein